MGSVFGNLETRWRNEAGNQRASFKTFGRLDSVDDERSHVDLREAYWAYEGEPVTVFDNDVFLGSRLALNDTQDSSLLAGVVVDVDSKEWFFNLEAERRIGEHYVAEARLRLFNGDKKLNQLFAFDQDDYFQLSISRFF